MSDENAREDAAEEPVEAQPPAVGETASAAEGTAADANASAADTAAPESGDAPEDQTAPEGEPPSDGDAVLEYEEVRDEPEVEAGAARTRAVERAAWVLLGLAILGLLAAVAGFLLLWPLNPQPSGQAVRVEIPLGSDTREIAQRLAEAGVVPNVNMFLLRARFAPERGKFKAGEYSLKTGTSYETVFKELAKGPTVGYVKVVIPEGFTIDQIAQRLHTEVGIPKDRFVQLAKHGAKGFDRTFLKDNPTDSLEGYLFPKTYQVKKGASASDVIDMMLDQFEKETARLDMSYARSKNMTLHDVVTVASMIERETRLPQERPLVSSVVYNRLRRNMYLEIDATIQYLLGGKARLLYSDLNVQSPYNTYQHKGLPPGPICNPGMDSINAAAHPAETDYIYYVLTGKDGSHTWAATRAEFLAAKARARQGLK